MNNQDISIIIADGDCELVAKQLLANTSRVDIKIVDKVTDGESAIESIRKYQPDVVLYEEGLDEEVLSGAVNAIRHADTLIIGGTSLVVYPAAGLIRYFRGDHLVVINMQPTGADAEADLCIAKPIGQVLSEDVTLDL